MRVLLQVPDRWRTSVSNSRVDPLPHKEPLLGERAQQRPNALRLTLVNDVDRAVTKHVTVQLGHAPSTRDRCMQRVVTLVPELLVLYRDPDSSVTSLRRLLALIG